MSILNPIPETPADKACRETTELFQSAKRTNLRTLRDGIQKTFGTDDHQAVMDRFGPEAARAVTMYESMVAWLQGVMSLDGDAEGLAELAGIVARVPAYTKNQNGTVTITA